MKTHSPRLQLQMLQIIGISFIVVTETSTRIWAGHVAHMHEKPQADDKMMNTSEPVSEANKYYQSGSVCWGRSLLDDYQQGLIPAVHSFNKSDLNDPRKRFNDCFSSVFQHCVGGWSNATGQHSDVQCCKWMFRHNNKHFPAHHFKKVPDQAVLCIYTMVLNSLFSQRG